MRASTLFAVTSSCTANTGTSQNACALSASCTGLGFTGEYQGGTDAMCPRSYTISKNMVFKACVMSGEVLILGQGSTTGKDMGDTLWNFTTKPTRHCTRRICTHLLRSIKPCWQELLVKLKHTRHCIGQFCHPLSH